jgi:DNA-binding LytR/AlgR family response regulator
MKPINQVLFWIIVLLALTFIFGLPNSRYIESFSFVALLLPVVIGTSYFFIEYLVPRYLFQKKLMKFTLYSIYMIIISMYLEFLVITLAFIYLANYQYENMIPVTTNVFILAITLYCIVFIYGFILLTKKIFRTEQSLLAFEEEKIKQKTLYLTVRVNRKMNKIPLEDIDYLESLGDYVKIITSSAPQIITKEKISSLDDKLPENFLRIHRSFIVNSEKIQSFTREEILLKNNTYLPISRTYKKRVSEFLSKEQGRDRYVES